jgi:hypothetical protein
MSLLESEGCEYEQLALDLYLIGLGFVLKVGRQLHGSPFGLSDRDCIFPHKKKIILSYKYVKYDN